MKPKSALRHFLALAGSSLLAISSASAVTLYFDGGTADIAGNGDGVSTNGTGTWNTTLTNWDAGVSPHVAWNNANVDDAYIVGTATISIGTPITAGKLTFTSTSVAARAISGSEITINKGMLLQRLSGLSWTSSIKLGDNQTWTHNQITANSTGKTMAGGTNLNGYTLTWDTINTASTNSISQSNITGTGNIIKNGTGWITLSGTYTGSTTVNNGTLNMGTSALGNVNNQLTVNGGTLNMASYSLTVGNLTGTGGVISGTSGTSLLTIGSGDAGGGNFQGAIQNGSGTTALTKTGTGTITLSGTNIYTGATNVNAGLLNVTGTLTSAVTVANDAALSGTGTTTGTLSLSTGSTIVGTTSGSSFKAETVTATGVAGVKIAGSTGSGTIGSHTISVVRYNTGAGPDTANFSTAGYRSVTSLTNVGPGPSETQLTYTNAARTWNSASGTWDAMTATTWQEDDFKYSQGDAIAFDDSGTGGGSARAVTLNSLVTPGSVTFNNSTSTYTVSGTGTIAGLSGLTKSGTGTVAISTTNTYAGGTTVTAGKLLINNTTGTGSGTGSGAVTVAALGTIGGSGTIAGAVNVTGTISAGNSIETLATGTLSMANTSTLVHELDSSVSTALGSDLLKVTGDLNFAGTVNLTLADLALTDVAFGMNDKFSLINYTGTWNGFLTVGVNELLDEEVFSFGLNTWRISYDDATGGLNYTGEYAGGTDSFVNLTAVTVIPEPSAALLGGLGLLMLLRRRR